MKKTLAVSLSILLMAAPWHASPQKDTLSTDDTYSELLLIEKHIHDLMSLGYTFDQAVAMITAHHSNKQFIASIDKLLEKQSLEQAINVVITNKEAEAYYARKNFWAKAKIISSIIGMLIVMYLLYKLRFPWWGAPKTQGTTEQEAYIEANIDNAPTKKDQPCNNRSTGNGKQPITSSRQIPLMNNYTSLENLLGSHKKGYTHDMLLAEVIRRQMDSAQTKGFYPESFEQSEPIPVQSYPLDRRCLYEIVKEQIEYAQENGLYHE